MTTTDGPGRGLVSPVPGGGWPRSFAIALAVLLSLGGCGFTAPRHADGYAELGSLGVRDVDRSFSLSIGPALLRFAASHIDDDPELRDLLRSLDGVRIRIYEVDGDPARVALRLDRIAGKLGADGWTPVVLVRDGDSETRMLVREIDGRICGLTLLSLDDDAEVVVINLIGDIRPERFGDVMLALDVEAPEARVASRSN